MKIFLPTVTLLAVLFTAGSVNAQEKKEAKSEKKEVKSDSKEVKSDSKAAPATKATPAKKATSAAPAKKATPATRATPAKKATPSENTEVKSTNGKSDAEPAKISVSDDGLPAEKKKKADH